MITEGLGFGIGATGGSTVVPVSNPDELTARLQENLDGKIIELAAGEYDFSGRKTEARTFTIHGNGTTIRGAEGANVTLRKFTLIVDLDQPNNLVIANIAFRSDGGKAGTRDAIDLVGSVPPEGSTASTATNSIRITQCSFDGYYDIAIDSHNVAGRPHLRATVDHCLFFDSRPGVAPPDSTFVNRGAINIDVNRLNKNAPRVAGNSMFTVAHNVFINVWRRSPRVAEGNFAHIFNNLLYQWGIAGVASLEPNNTTWRGMEVGGGNTGAAGNNGTAVIQANRFIPAPNKTNPEDAIKVHRGTTVDYGGSLPNEFDILGGQPVRPQPEFAGGTALSLSSFYGKLDVPPVTAAEQFDWSALLESVGPPMPAGAPGDPRSPLRLVLRGMRPFVTTAAG